MSNVTQLSLFAEDARVDRSHVGDVPVGALVCTVHIGDLPIGALLRTKRGHLCTVAEISKERGCVWVRENGGRDNIRCPEDMAVQVLG